VVQASGGGVAVHSSYSGVEQNRSAGTGADRGVDGAADGGWQGHQDNAAALADHA
jgi:hypothetical protein